MNSNERKSSDQRYVLSEMVQLAKKEIENENKSRTRTQ